MASSNSKNQRRPVSQDSFLEALRDLGRGVIDEGVNQAKKIVTDDIPSSFGFGSTAGSLQPNESLSMSEIMAAEKRGENRTAFRLNEELRLSQRRESEAKSQIKAIQDEIKLLAKSIGDFSHEIQVAALQAPANPGVYHQSFFEQLRSFIKALRARVQDSRHWLAAQNQRAKKRQGFYWGNVQKSGTKYMLSSERYMVTTTG